MTSVEYLMSKKITPAIRIVAGSNKAEAFVTMTIEQFEEYAEYCADKAYGDGYTDALRVRPRRTIDTVVEYCEQKTYTTEDIFGFIKWGFTKPGYMRNYFNYFHGDTKGFFTIPELLKKWEDWKAQQGKEATE